MRLGEAIYKSQAYEGPDGDESPMGGRGDQDDDVVDADFEDLGEDKRGR
jgi:molecular chaperone DnaK